MNHSDNPNKRNKGEIQPKESTIVVIRYEGRPHEEYSLHRETFLRNPETDELLRMIAWHNVPIYPSFWPLDKYAKAQFAIVFPPLPHHWRTFELWEMKGLHPFYATHISRRKDELYILNFSPK